jgi:hypothetical protein
VTSLRAWRWRPIAAFALAAGLLWGAGVLALDRASHGWFWTYCFALHQRHPFYPQRAWRDAPLELWRAQPVLWLGLAAALADAAVRRTLTRRLGVVALFAAAGAAISCLGYGTAWAYRNALLPGLLFPALLWAACLARAGATGGPRASLVAALAAAVHLGASVYDPRPHLPHPEDRAAGDRLIERLRAAPGEVLVPFHPWYAVMAGKPAHFHRMGLLDVVSGGLGRPRGLDDAIAAQRFALVVMDYKVVWANWPGLPRTYRETARLRPGIDSPRVIAGADTYPLHVLEPRLPNEPLGAAGPAGSPGMAR